MTEANGSAIPVQSGSAERCFIRISLGLAPTNGTVPVSNS
jgi:hypothetical protein